jgi:hypothetical protein
MLGLGCVAIQIKLAEPKGVNNLLHNVNRRFIPLYPPTFILCSSPTLFGRPTSLPPFSDLRQRTHRCGERVEHHDVVHRFPAACEAASTVSSWKLTLVRFVAASCDGNKPA